ncbi:MAG: hypothetical protein ACP5HJ_02520 [Candidatus Micrarchaeia archaeon]
MKIRIFSKKNYPELSKLYKNFEVVKDNEEVTFVVGGDGTLLKAIKNVSSPIIAIKGKEEDSLGFKTQFYINEIDEAIKLVKSKAFKIERFHLVEGKSRDKTFFGGNEIGIKSATEKEIHFEVFYKKQNEEKFKKLYPYVLCGDGIIFVSRLGSSAWNRKVGGPLLLEEGIIVQPIGCDFGYPFVASKEFEFFVKVIKGKAKIIADGEKILDSNFLRAKLSEKYANIIIRKENIYNLLNLLKFYISRGGRIR